MTKAKKQKVTTGAEFFKKIDELIDQQLLTAKGWHLKNSLEETLCNAFQCIALAIFKDTYDLTDLSKSIRALNLAYGYTMLAREYIQPEDVVPLFIAHFGYRRKKDSAKNSDKPELSLERIQKMHEIMNRASALPSEVAVLFDVERRQVRRWIERGDLKKGRDGKILRDEYLEFSRAFSIKRYGRGEYGSVATEFSKMKLQSVFKAHAEKLQEKRDISRPIVNLKKQTTVARKGK